MYIILVYMVVIIDTVLSFYACALYFFSALYSFALMIFFHSTFFLLFLLLFSSLSKTGCGFQSYFTIWFVIDLLQFWMGKKTREIFVKKNYLFTPIKTAVFFYLASESFQTSKLCTLNLKEKVQKLPDKVGVNINPLHYNVI